MRRRDEQTEEQRERLREAETALRDALGDLTLAAAQAAARRCPLEDVYAAVNAVRRAEEAVDLARLDLATASGEDA